MESNQPVAAFDVVEQRLLLLGSDRGVVAVEHQRVVELEFCRRERVCRCRRVGELDAPPRERRREEREHLDRIVRPFLILAEEQDPDWPARLGNACRPGAAATRTPPLSWRRTRRPRATRTAWLRLGQQ